MGMIAFVKHPHLHEHSVQQKEAGNYKKRKIAWQGMEISIENEAGSMRRGTNRDGVEWEQRISSPYGYLRGTEGVDGDHVDVFVGPNMDAPVVHVVHARKVNRWDEYDEDKIMLGFNSADEAKAAFLDNYSDPRFFGDMVAMPVDEFLAKVKATKETPAMIKGEQLSLFDEVTQVAGSVKADGTVVKPYVRVQKKAHKPQPETKAPVAETKPAERATKEAERATKPPKDETVVPDTVYHGGHVAGITKFDRMGGAAAKSGMDSLDTLGHWWTVDRADAAHYGPRIYQAKLHITNPFILNSIDELRPLARKVGATYMQDGIDKREKISGSKLRAHIEAQGYDGMHIKGGEQGSDYWVTLNPEQIELKGEEEAKPATKAKLGQFGAAGESKMERRNINREVVELLADGKTDYSADEMQLLALYSGNGGCGDSLNEFYTDPKVATAMWSVLERLGVHGTALEPSCGTGVFLHTAPADIKVTGVEIDPVSAKIANILHGDRHEVRDASMERFATSDERQFDAVIGNAPFGIRGGSIKDDKPDVTRADTYFIDAALDKTAAGGIVAMIVHHGVLDSARDRAMRERFLTKGQFLGAIRMPNTAFEHSQTEVTADILFFKKRPQDVANALGTLKQEQLQALGVWDEEYLSGGYFDGRGKDSIMGAVEPGWRAKAGMGNDITVTGSMQGVPEHIAAWTPDDNERAEPGMGDILGILADDPAAKARALGAAIRKPYELTKVGSIKTVDGVQYILEGSPPRWHRVDEVMDREAVTAGSDLADRVDSLMRGTGDRDALAEDIKAYVAKFGNPSSNADLLTAASQDRTLYKLIGAVNKDGSLSDIFKPRAAAVISSFETAAQTLAVENADGMFTPEELAARTAKDLDAVEDLLYASSDYAISPAGRWTTMDQYLTGELWPRLDELKSALERTDIDATIRQKYELQAKRLDETIDAKSLEDVDVAVNHAFIPLDVITAYFNDRKNESDNEWIRKQEDMSIRYGEGVYSVSGGRYPHGDLLERYLNRSGVKKEEWDDITKLNTDFKNWLLSSRFRDQIETMYNRKFRGYVAPAFSNAPIDIPGMNTDGLKQFQYGGTRWALAHGKGIIAADVGLGKTVRALMIARLMKLQGTANRNMIVVPKSVIANWAKEAEKWFPGTRVLTIGETVTGDKSRADTAAERNHKLHQYMQNDYDFVFISQPAFNDLDVDPETKNKYTNDDFWVQRGDKLGNAGDKRVKAVREAYEQHVATRDFEKRTKALYFNDLGVDLLMADEAHAYKNLFAVRNRFGESPKFLGGGGLSNRALDMQMKARAVRDAHDGKGVFSLTATPTKNSPLEIYSMLMHVAPEVFDQVGIRNSEEFLDRFCEFATGPCLQTDGSIADSLYVSGFKNMEELRTMMRKHIDRQTADDVGLVLPKRDDHMHMIDMSTEQKAVYEDLRQQALESSGKDATGDSHIFSIMDKMGKAALDLELLGAEHAGAHSPKYAEVAKTAGVNAADGGQIIFCEAIKAHDKIKASLVAQGIKDSDIAIFNAQTAKTGDARQKIQDQFNTGKIKVVIGNKTMEEGVNLQKGTADIHHMDIAWEPATMQQRNGRGLRQGNTKASVRIHSYLSKGSFDGYRYQSVMAKKSWQDLLWKGGDKIENLERPTMTRDEVMVMMSADPDAARAKMEANHALAQERYLASKTQDASSDFMRFQTMKRSYAALKNKTSDAAERLRIRLASSKEKLQDNKYFKAKAALDSEKLVLLHPDTGMIMQHGAGVERDGKKWVVVSVDPAEQTVTMRAHGGIGKSAHTVTMPVTDMKDVKPFDYSEVDETAEISKQFNADSDDVTDMKSLRNVPHAVITANHKAIQAKLKTGLAEYKWVTNANRIPYFEGGEAKTGDTYDAHKLGERDDIELMLPTPEHRERAIAEYIKAEQGKELRSESPSYNHRARTRHVSNASRLVSKYKDGSYSSESANPWESAGNLVFGDEFGREARSAFDKHQQQVMQSAPTFAEALRAAQPTVMTGHSHSGAKWPQTTIAILFAKAKHDGILDQPLVDVVPKKNQYGYMADEIHKDAWKIHSNRHHNATDVRPMPVADALIHMATAGGHSALAAAMIVSSRPAIKAASDLMELPLTDPAVIASVSHLADRHPEVAAMKVAGNFMQEHMMHVHLGHGHGDITFGELSDMLHTRAGMDKPEAA